MKALFPILITAVIFIISKNSLAETPSKTYILTRGQHISIKSHPNSTVLVGNGAIASVKDIGNKLMITGKKLGSTTLSIGSHRYQIKVIHKLIFDSYHRLQKLLHHKRGLNLKINSSQISVEGHLLRATDWFDLGAQLPNSILYSFNPHISQPIKESISHHFAKLFSRANLLMPNISFNPIEFSTPATNKKNIDAYNNLLRPYGIKIKNDLNSLLVRPMIKVKIILAEVRKNSFHNLGIKWPTQIQAQIHPQVVFDPLSAQLNFLEEKGWGKILASPTLLCKSHEKATFLAGGEFPIRLVHRKSSSVTWKRHGIVLTIEPKADQRGSLDIALKAEVSVLDMSQSVDGVPGLLTNRIQSHFNLRKSRTVVLSGLVKSEWGKSLHGWPGLSQIPILGSLFGSSDFRNQRTELTIFVTPEIISPNSEN